ncbi:hypothetical protein CRG98_039854 [Punica granatum]|uniref:Uncharacterized protein n=1 Tax=Punica granatum TaxID=22663 RepID=A0A2I0I728_PUNGR|nr:hypothetical protein CRG98_039854 [Punica granatum]
MHLSTSLRRRFCGAVGCEGPIRPKPRPGSWRKPIPGSLDPKLSPARPFFLLSSWMNPNFSFPSSPTLKPSTIAPKSLSLRKNLPSTCLLLRASIDGPPPASSDKLACPSFQSSIHLLQVAELRLLSRLLRASTGA